MRVRLDYLYISLFIVYIGLFIIYISLFIVYCIVYACHISKSECGMRQISENIYLVQGHDIMPVQSAVTDSRLSILGNPIGELQLVWCLYDFMEMVKIELQI